MGNSSYNAYITSPAWAEKRRQALELWDHRCALCDSGQDLQVHHRTYDRFGAESSRDMTVLCYECHALYHNLMRDKVMRTIHRVITAAHSRDAAFREVQKTLGEHPRSPECLAAARYAAHRLGLIPEE